MYRPYESWTEWFLSENGDKCAKNHAVCDGAIAVAKVYGNGYPAGNGWAKSSEDIARLMSAAPQLLAACEKLAEWDASDGDVALISEACSLARAAIAKAHAAKRFYTQQNIGRAKYVVNFYNGSKKHGDGSDFYDIAIFKNKKDFNSFVDNLRSQGYLER